MEPKTWKCLDCLWEGSNVKEHRIMDIILNYCPKCTKYLGSTEDATKVIIDTIKGIKVYAKNSRRIKTKLGNQGRNSRCRSLSVKEIADREKEMIENGDNINPVHIKEMEMSKSNDRKARLSRLAESMTNIIKEKGHFFSSMIKESKTYRDYICPDSSRYFKRTFLDDIKELGEKGLFYSTGRSPKTWYIGSRHAKSSLSNQKENDKCPSGLYISHPVKVKGKVPGDVISHVVIDINLNVNVFTQH